MTTSEHIYELTDTGTEDNIDRFNEVTTAVLVTLYTSFPTKVFLKRKDFKLDDTYEDKQFLEGTMEFLRREGYIDYAQSAGHGDIYSRVQLTSIGLALLDSLPESLQKDRRIIDIGKEAMKTGAKEGFKEFVKVLTSTGLGLIIRQ